MVYKDLSVSLGEQQPFYAFQSSGLDGKSPILKTVEEMATLYIDEMQKIDPQGPYILAGYSFGADISFEMLLQLQEKGFEVEKLLIFDSGPPTEKDEDEAQIAYKELLMLMINDINKEYNSTLKATEADFEGKTKEEQLEVLYALIRASEIEITESQMRGTIGVIMANQDCKYTTEISEKLNTQIILFKADDGSNAKEIKREESRGYGWQELTTKKVIIKHIQTEHITLFNMPYAAEIANYINDEKIITT